MVGRNKCKFGQQEEKRIRRKQDARENRSAKPRKNDAYLLGHDASLLEDFHAHLPRVCAQTTMPCTEGGRGEVRARGTEVTIKRLCSAIGGLREPNTCDFCGISQGGLNCLRSNFSVLASMIRKCILPFACCYVTLQKYVQNRMNEQGGA